MTTQNQAETELCRLAAKWRTDKTPSILHGYTPYYHELLKGREVRKMLEIGIGCPGNMGHMENYHTVGASLHMWEEYFPGAEIYGLDVRPDILVNEGRIKSFQCDQGSEESLREAARKLGNGFDLVIDDGSHQVEHQVLSAKVLIPLLLKPNGIYVIEDVWAPEEVVPNLPYACTVRAFRPEVFISDRLVVMQGRRVTHALIAILSCHDHRAWHWQDAQRETWIKDIPAGVDYRFFLGNPRIENAATDEVFLDVPDGYAELSFKTKGAIEWALGHGYKYMHKTDIDTLINPVNLMNSGFEQYDYVGGCFMNPPAPPFASGGAGYWLNERAMRIMAFASAEGEKYEDVFVATTLLAHGISLHDDKRYKYCPESVLDKETISFHLSSTPGWLTKYAPDQMFAKYAEAKAL